MLLIDLSHPVEMGIPNRPGEVFRAGFEGKGRLSCTGWDKY